MTKKRNIHELIVKEAPSLNNLLDTEDVSKFKELTNELRNTFCSLTHCQYLEALVGYLAS